jgi:tRNA G10  N-methylase Trm11
LLKKGEIDCVATEPFMGPFINTVLPEAVVKKTVVELELLYGNVFAELAKLLEKGQRVVFILPSIPCTSGKKIAVSENVFSKAGFAVVNPVGTEVFPYSYLAIDSKILRIIYVLAKA